MQLFVRNVTSGSQAARAAEPLLLGIVASLLLAIAVVQYRGLAAWSDAETERAERRWTRAVEQAAGGLNASLGGLYAAVVDASQRHELAGPDALSFLVDRWRARDAFGPLVSRVHADVSAVPAPRPFVASWITEPGSAALPEMMVTLPPESGMSGARFEIAPDACERLRATMGAGPGADAVPEIEVAIGPAATDGAAGCATPGYDASRRPEASAAVFRLGLPARSPAHVASMGVVAEGPPGLAPQWLLRAQRRGGSLAEALARSRRRTVWAAAASEALLIAAVAVVAVSGWQARRRARAHLAFAAAVAHEIRTPLAALKVLGQNQARGIVTSGPQVVQYGEAVVSEADRLHAFVERVLHFASGHTRAVGPARTPIECHRLVADALQPLEDRLRLAGIEVQTVLPPAPLRVLGDEPSLVLALRNLLQNVLDHGAGARHVEVAIAVRGRHLEFTVADDGHGVPAADRRALFTPFARGRRAREQRTAGHGLGLAMVADVAAWHHGSAWFDGADGRTTFGFRIRLDADAQEAA